MASEIRTLKDKDIQVLPRTRADAVSTTDGSTVQDKINDIPTTLSELTDDSTHRLVTDTEKSTWNGKSNFSGAYDDLTGKPTIPTKLSELSEDATHQLVTYIDKSNWNGKSEFDGDYNKLSNKPYIPIVSSSVSSSSTITAASSSALKSVYDLANSKLSEVFYVGTSSPSNTKLLWIDTANGGILKYYYSGSWKNVYSVWA